MMYASGGPAATEEAGAKAIPGVRMFVHQAAVQFELWTGRTPDLQKARDLVTREIHSL